MTDFTRSNRALTARRQDWPDGALSACNVIESRYPAWHPLWQPGSNDGPNRQRGFYATRRGAPVGEEPLFGESAADLLRLIRFIEEEREAEEAERREWLRMWTAPPRQGGVTTGL